MHATLRIPLLGGGLGAVHFPMRAKNCVQAAMNLLAADVSPFIPEGESRRTSATSRNSMRPVNRGPKKTYEKVIRVAAGLALGAAGPLLESRRIVTQSHGQGAAKT